MSENAAPAALGESRYCGTVDMMLLYVEAKKLGLNRNLPDEVAMDLDPDGNHVLTVLLADHRADPARGLPTHHRASVILKMRGSAVPRTALLDVTDAYWTRLYTHEETVDLAVWQTLAPTMPLRLRPRLFDEIGAGR